MKLSFLTLVNTGINASWLIGAILLLRLALKKAPRSILCALWALVAIRLLCPFSIESSLSLLPSGEVIPAEILTYEGSQLQESAVITIVDNPLYPEPVQLELTLDDTVDRVQAGDIQWTLIWLAGMGALALYAVVSYARLRLQVRTAAPLRDRVWLCDDIDSPFILGIFSPRIYLPSDLEEPARSHVIAHEAAHLKRHDHWWKAIGFALLTVYWFNPLVWVAYILLCRDIELACDEKVIQALTMDGKKAYSEALLQCSMKRSLIAACPLTFGEVGVKQRIQAVLHYKKPAFWVILAAVIACIAVAVGFLTNPVSNEPAPADGPPQLGAGQVYVSEACVYMNPLSSYYPFGGDSGYRYILGEDSLTFEDKDGSAHFVIEDITWQWQDFPWENEQFCNLYGFGSPNMENIMKVYGTILYYQPLNSGYFMIYNGNDILLAQIKELNKLGAEMWCTYSLVSEESKGSAEWVYRPKNESERGMKVECDLPTAQIQATSSFRWTIDDYEGLYTKHLDGGNAFYLAPEEANGTIVDFAEISVTINTNNRFWNGTIYMTREESFWPDQYVYNVTIVGEGLTIGPNEDGTGVVISVDTAELQPTAQIAASDGFLDEPYVYPVVPGTEEWNALDGHDQMIKACQIPEDILSRLSTKALLETVLGYPLLGDIGSYVPARRGYDVVLGSFNGLQELVSREDLAKVMAEFSLEGSNFDVNVHADYQKSFAEKMLGYIEEYSLICYIDEQYVYPVTPGTAEWDAMSLEEQIAACQIPEDILPLLSSEYLGQAVLDYPFLNIVFEEGGYEKLFQQFNGLQELASRKDGARGLLFAPGTIADYNAEIQVEATNLILENLP